MTKIPDQADVQNLNKLYLIKAKLADAKLLVQYLERVTNDSTFNKLFHDISGAHVSCTVAIAILEERVDDKTAGTDIIS